MAIKSGFFNSEAGDRKYDAEDMNKFFDGVITDGVLRDLGDDFLVVPSSGLQIAAGAGKAWFLKSWIENTSDAFLTLSDADVTFGRIDIIALDFDKSDQVRENDIVIVEGTPAGSPTPPTLIDTSTHLQKPLAHIQVDANETVIQAGDITNKVGTVDCPYSAGIVELLTGVDDVTIEIVSNDLQVKDDGITNAKIADNQIDSEHYVDASIDRVHLETDIIDATKLENNTVNSEHYVDGSIDRVHLAADIIDDTKIENDAIKSEHYAPGSIDNEHLAANIIDDDNIGNRVPMFTSRQGGSATIWSTFGNNNYTPTTVKMEGGVKNIGSIADSALSGLITITFAQPFAYNPLIQITAYANTSYGFLRVQSISTTEITFDFKNEGIEDDFKAHWLAIGEE